MQGYRPLWETPIDALVAVMRYETPDGHTVLLPLDSSAHVYQLDDISLMRNTAQEAAAEAQLQQFNLVPVGDFNDLQLDLPQGHRAAWTVPWDGLQKRRKNQATRNQANADAIIISAIGGCWLGSRDHRSRR